MKGLFEGLRVSDGSEKRNSLAGSTGMGMDTFGIDDFSMASTETYGFDDSQGFWSEGAPGMHYGMSRQN